MKRCMAILLVLVMAVAMLAGCASTPIVEDVQTDARFVVVVMQGSNVVYADTETGVMYYFHKGGYGGGMSVMVDADGNPLIWDGFDGSK